MPDVTFTGQLTEADFGRLQALHTRRVVQAWSILLTALVAFLAWRWGWKAISAFPADAAMLFLPLVLILPLSLLVRPLVWRRHWLRSKALHQPIKGLLSAEGVRWNSEGLSQNQVPWNLLLHYRASPTLVLLYFSPNQFFYFFPHYFASEADWREFRTLVAQKLPCK